MENGLASFRTRVGISDRIFSGKKALTICCSFGRYITVEGAARAARSTLDKGESANARREYGAVEKGKQVIMTVNERAVLSEPKSDKYDEMSSVYDRYGSPTWAIWSAVQGQRFVDLGGWEITFRDFDCWDSVTQKPADTQPFHFLRKAGQAGGQGALDAIQESIAMFEKVFLEAVYAPDTELQFQDGGLAKVSFTAWRPTFILGRALHLLQGKLCSGTLVRQRTLSNPNAFFCRLLLYGARYP